MRKVKEGERETYIDHEDWYKSRVPTLWQLVGLTFVSVGGGRREVREWKRLQHSLFA